MLSSTAGYDQRPRFKVNCLPCRRRKSKCDRLQPCSPCVMRDTARECYAGQEPPPVPYHETRPSPTVVASEPKTASIQSRPTTATSAASSPPSKRVRLSTNVEKDGEQRWLNSEAHLDHHQGSSSTHPFRSTLEGLQNALSESVARLVDTERLLAKAHSVLDEEPKQSKRSERRPRNVSWDSLQDVLPGETECWLLLDVFFSDLDWLITIVYKPWFMNVIWNGGLRRGSSITLSQGALLCSMLALAALLAPATHTAKRMDEVKEEERNNLVQHAMFLLESEDDLAGGWRSSAPKLATLPRLQAELLICHYLLNSGSIEVSYLRLGACIRQAKQIGLFDDRGRDWRVKFEQSGLLANYSHDEQHKMDQGKEGSRDGQATRALQPGGDPRDDVSAELRKRLAWDLIILDWWQNLQWSRPPDINQADVHLSLPNYLGDGFHLDSVTNPRAFHLDDVADSTSAARPRLPFVENYMARIRLTQILPSVGYFMNTMTLVPASVRYDQARRLDRDFTQWATVHGHSLHQVEESVQSGGAEAHRGAAQKVINHTACAFLRCLIHKCFLSDKDAPEDLKFRALVHARGIMEAMPLLITLSGSPHVLFNPSWCAEHLFHAATAFAFVLLTRDESTPLNLHRVTNATDTFPPSLSSTTGRDKPIDDLLWFATHISEIIRTLQRLGSSSKTASVCEQILSRLCDSKKNIKLTMQRLHSQRHQAAANGVAGRDQLATGKRVDPRSPPDESRLRHPSNSSSSSSPPSEQISARRPHRVQWSAVSTAPTRSSKRRTQAASTASFVGQGGVDGGVSNGLTETTLSDDPGATFTNHLQVSASQLHSGLHLNQPVDLQMSMATDVMPATFTPHWDASTATPTNLDTFSWLFLQEMDWTDMLRDSNSNSTDLRG